MSEKLLVEIKLVGDTSSLMRLMVVAKRSNVRIREMHVSSEEDAMVVRVIVQGEHRQFLSRVEKIYEVADIKTYVINM